MIYVKCGASLLTAAMALCLGEPRGLGRRCDRKARRQNLDAPAHHQPEPGWRPRVGSEAGGRQRCALHRRQGEGLHPVVDQTGPRHHRRADPLRGQDHRRHQPLLHRQKADRPQNKAAKTKLKMPLLAVGSQYFIAADSERQMREVAEDVRGVILLPGHQLAEECPEQLAAEYIKFFG